MIKTAPYQYDMAGEIDMEKGRLAIPRKEYDLFGLVAEAHPGAMSPQDETTIQEIIFPIEDREITIHSQRVPFH